jgi:hypothetical protein
LSLGIEVQGSENIRVTGHSFGDGRIVITQSVHPDFQGPLVDLL